MREPGVRGSRDVVVGGHGDAASLGRLTPRQAEHAVEAPGAGADDREAERHRDQYEGVLSAAVRSLDEETVLVVERVRASSSPSTPSRTGPAARSSAAASTATSSHNSWTPTSAAPRSDLAGRDPDRRPSDRSNPREKKRRHGYWRPSGDASQLGAPLGPNPRVERLSDLPRQQVGSERLLE
jgi:hypothetical protein